MASSANRNVNDSKEDDDSDGNTYYDLHRMHAWDWEYVKRRKIAKINRKFTEMPLYYAIVAPKSFRPNSDFVVRLTLFSGTAEREITDPIVVSATIMDDDDVGGADLYRVDSTATMQLNVTESITIPVGALLSPDASYKLVVKAIQGIDFVHEANLDVLTKNVAILIQTDKGVYRPGDSVKFRVFVLDENLRPATIGNNPLSISVRCRRGNTLNVWTQTNTENGVFADEFQLDATSESGTYVLEALVTNDKKIATFKVVEYIAPDFEAVVEMSEHFSVCDRSIWAIVRAKDENQGPIRGKVNVTISNKVRLPYSYSPDDDEYYEEEDDGDGEDGDDIHTVATQTRSIDGHAIVDFRIANLIDSDEDTMNKYFTVKFEIVDGPTGGSVLIERMICVHTNPFKIEIDKDVFEFLAKDSKYDLKFSVRHHNNSPIDMDDSNKKITIHRKRYFRDDREYSEMEEERQFELDDNGYLFYTIDTMRNEMTIVLTAFYLDQSEKFVFHTGPSESEFMDTSSLGATILTERCELDLPIEIEVSSRHQLDVISYVITSRQKIYETKTVRVPLDAEKVYRFTFVPTFEMRPRVNVIIYCMEGSHLLSKRISIDLKKSLANRIELSAERIDAASNGTFDINVRSVANALVGLVGVNQSTLLLGRGNDLTNDELWNQMDAFHTEISLNRFRLIPATRRNRPKYVNYFDAFNDAGLILFTNAQIPVQPMSRDVLDSEMHACSEYSMYPSLDQVRNEFPETWLWQTIPSDQFNGEHSIQATKPTSITSWIVFGFAIDPDRGLAITNAPTKQEIHKPFYVTFNIPQTAKCGDTISIPCTVFNYLEQHVDAEVSLENNNNEFVFVNIESNAGCSTGSSHRYKVSIAPAIGAKFKFVVRLTKIGLTALKIVASTAIAGDSVLKTLIVDARKH